MQVLNGFRCVYVRICEKCDWIIEALLMREYLVTSKLGKAHWGDCYSALSIFRIEGKCSVFICRHMWIVDVSPNLFWRMLGMLP